ncbi:MAG: sulfotransferase [Phycisphaerae bacterium]|nr:sulfotransferase [Phycisphaerae bacterium]
MDVLANFALIGPGKSGTTALYSLLTRHPQVAMATVKETCYFNDHHARGHAWYRALYPATIGPDVRAIGEVSNTYIFSAAAADRMRAYNPDMKAVACLRNPVERTFSHWLFLKRNAEIDGTFEDALRLRPDLVERGKYAMHLDPWFAALGKERVLVLVFDDFVKSPLAVYNRLLGFIGVDEVASAELDDGDRLPASAPRSRLAARAVKAVANAVRKAGHPRLIQLMKDSPLPRMLYRPYGRNDRPTMSAETRAQLGAQFADDASRLGDMLGRDLRAEWGLRP